MLVDLKPVVGPVQAEVGVRGAVQSGRKRVRDRRAEDRAAPNAHPATLRSAVTAAGVGLAPGLELLPDLLEVRLVVGELGLAGVEVHRDEVQPLALLGVRRRLQRGLAGRGDRPGRQALVPVGVVLRLALAVLLRGGVGLQLLGVDDGRVEPSFMPLSSRL